MPLVDVTVAKPEDRDAIANLMQLYTHDFSDYWAGTARGELESDGRFAAYPLEPYWRESGRIPLLVAVDQRLAGFALINDVAHSGLPVDHNMAEFFVARKHRRGGVGTLAVTEILNRYPGQWEVAVTRRNVGALTFWRSVITTHPLVEHVEESDSANESWNGPILRVRIRPALLR